MKKVLAICVVLAVIMSMSVTVFAAPTGFVSSPSNNQAPVVDSFEPSDDDCDAEIVITPYADKEELSETLLALIQKAYEEINNTKDLTTLNSALAAFAKEKKIKGTNLLVSDLFDIHAVGCDNHEGHYDFEVTLKAGTLKNFVALLHMKADGEWEMVKDAKVLKDGKTLRFSVDSFSPFAIVVEKDDSKSPQTNDNSLTYVYAILMTVSALGVLVLTLKSKKQSA